MTTARKLPKARKRYYIEEPVILIRLADYERMYEHLIKMGLFEKQPKNVKEGLTKRHTLLLKEARQKISAARRHYNIKETARLMSAQEAQEDLNQIGDALLS